MPLAALTTMRVGGCAARLVTVTSTEELLDAVRAADVAGEPLLVLSGGSNVVVADAGFPGTVVHVATRGVRVESADGRVRLRVAAGEPWSPLVDRAVEEGWAGVEALAGIPGGTGSTPIQNVGAYGQEVAGTVEQVRAWDRHTASVRTFTTSGCGFGYRDSVFKRANGRYVVLDVLFALRAGGRSEPVRYPALADELGVAGGAQVPLAEVRAAVLALRRRRGMVLDPADPDTCGCGSFFTNPVLRPGQFAALQARAATLLGGRAGALPRWPAAGGRAKTSAAWLLEQAGFGKGFGLPGPAAVSTKHPLAVTNRGSASAADVVALARTLRDGVAERFGVVLPPEPVLVGLRL